MEKKTFNCTYIQIYMRNIYIHIHITNRNIYIYTYNYLYIMILYGLTYKSYKQSYVWGAPWVSGFLYNHGQL